MALIQCPKCGKEFSDRALKCPQCGTSKEEVLRLIKEQAEHEAVERERIRKEQEAEEARIRAEWWAANKKKIIIAIFLFILIIAAIIGIRSCMTFMGKCGERLFWYYNSSNKTLTIKGSGPMKNFKSINYLSYNPDSTDAVPWRVYRKEIQNIVLDEDITTIGDRAFSSCSSLHSVKLPNNIKCIGEYSFHSCDSLESVYLSSNLEIIGRGAFELCYSLSNITFPSSLKTIEDNAFFYCIGLTSITLSNSVTSIGYQAFYNCNKVASIICRASAPPSCGSMAFYNISTSVPIYVPAASINVFKNTVIWKNFTNIKAINE